MHDEFLQSATDEVETTMTPQHRTTLAAEDAARLHMSAAENPMLISALLLLDRPIAREELETRLRQRLARHPRFRQLVTEPRLGLGMPRWSGDPSFDVRHHMHRIDASLFHPAPAIEDLVADVASIPLPRRRPLWRVHLIDGGEPAVLVTVHHALADGAALLQLLAELVDDAPVAPAPAESTPDPHGRAWRIAAGALAAGRLAISRNDPVTALRGRLGERKELAASAALSLDELRTTSHRLGTTVTGVLLAAVAGACRALFTSASGDGLVIHALVPVSLQREHDASLGNHYGSVLVPLPVGTAELSTRIRLVRDSTRRLRSRSAGAAGARLAAAAGAMAAFVERAGVSFFSRKASVVVSSVRGLARQAHLCGAAVRDIVVWAPASGRIALSVTLMSYADRVRLGVAADGHVIGDARRVAQELERELASISAYASTATV